MVCLQGIIKIKTKTKNSSFTAGLGLRFFCCFKRLDLKSKKCKSNKRILNS
uniref:Uncharacterized protein n=1 Tax=Siphoviridae sp. ct2KB1 TaxID=2827768 RepID=A0A8S5SLN0_9CAUD|nr:MAG TPA: hypothetical protein [Siphoviridae sp. ct2KB1]